MVKRTASCDCGKVRFEAHGAPILTAVCYCTDCQAGGRLLESLQDAPSVLDDDGGASCLAYRDDRIKCVAGAELLDGYRLMPDSPTKRFVATCCNSGMYVKYTRGHWTSAYRKRFDDEDLPPIEMRTNIRHRSAGTDFHDTVPSYRRFPIKLFSKLIAARVSMMFGR